MSTRQRIFMMAAAAMSVMVHAAVLYQVMNLPLALTPGSRLFAQTPTEKRIESVRVYRATEDVIVDQQPDTPALDAPKPDEQAAELQEETKKLLDAAEKSPALEPKDIKEERLEGGGDPRIDTPPPTGQTAAPGQVRSLDTTQKLLKLAQPSIVLPEYIGPTDAVTYADPSGEAVDPGSQISAAQVKQLDKMLGGPGGSGVASGAPTDDDDGKAAADAEKPMVKKAMPMPEKKEDQPGDNGATQVAAATPKLPKLPGNLMQLDPAASNVQGDSGDPIHLDDDFNYTLTKFDAPPRKVGGFLGLGAKEIGPEDGYYEVKITPKRSLRKLSPLKKDVVWVIDTSGSIRQRWVDAVRKGVSVALDGLNDGDRFNIVMFKDTVNVFSPDGLIEFNNNTLSSARRFLASAESSGETDVNRALGRLIVRNVPNDRVYQIVLVTDGKPTAGSLDARQIINLITRENDLVGSIFCVGVGDSMNRELLEFLAYRNKGNVVYPESAEQAAGSLRELASELRYPVLKDATFDAVGVDTSRIYPRIPRDIYQGKSLHLYGRYTDASETLSMRLTGVNGPDVLDFTFRLDFDEAQLGDESLARRWGFWKLHHLYSEVIRQGQTEQLNEQMDSLRERYDLKTAY